MKICYDPTKINLENYEKSDLHKKRFFVRKKLLKRENFKYLFEIK